MTTTRLSILQLVVFTCFILHISSLLNKVPGLYLDRIQMWNTQGAKDIPASVDPGRVKEWNPSSEEQKGPGNFSFTITWRQTLKEVVSSGLSLYNFKTGKDIKLSFQLKILTLVKTYATVELVTKSRLVYLAFSVIVITQQNNFVELLTVEPAGLNENVNSQHIKKSRFKLAFNSTRILGMIEWMTFQGLTQSTKYSQRFVYSGGFQISNNQSHITLDLKTYSIKNIKLHVLVINLFNQDSQIIYKQGWNNGFHIQKQAFGSLFRGYCLSGLRYLQLYFYSSNTGKDSFFLFKYLNPSSISQISTYNVQSSRRYILMCLAQCRKNQLFNGSLCAVCSVLIPHCATCQSAYKCKKCQQGGFALSPTKQSCSCPLRTYFNPQNRNCSNCPYDCLTCNSTGHCLSCYRFVDFRQLDQKTSRCVPLAGYFQTNQTVSGWCSANCKTCTSLQKCSQCFQRFVVVPSTTRCKSCPFDCLTCDSQDNCLTCSSTDFRQIKKLNSSRCKPIKGYYQSSQSKSFQCPQQCTQCISASFCISCQEQYLLEESNEESICYKPFNFAILWGILSFLFTIAVGFALYRYRYGVRVFCRRIRQKIRRRKPEDRYQPNQLSEHPEHSDQQFQYSKKQKIVPQRQSDSSDKNVVLWYKKLVAEKNPICNICMFPHPHFRSSCGHNFHIQCIIEWCFSNQKCISCDQDLTTKQHCIICKECGQRQRAIKYVQIKQITSDEAMMSSTVCDLCRGAVQKMSKLHS